MKFMNSTRNASLAVRSLLPAIVLAVLTTAGARTANAEDGPGDLRRETVRYAPNDLLTEAGTRALYRQLVAAAGRVCLEDLGDPLIRLRAKQCRQRALREAVAQVLSPQLAHMLSTRDACELEAAESKASKAALAAGTSLQTQEDK